MRVSEIIAHASEGFNLMRSREKREVELTFGSPDEASRFETWCVQRHIATNGWRWGDYRVTVFVDG